MRRGEDRTRVAVLLTLIALGGLVVPACQRVVAGTPGGDAKPVVVARPAQPPPGAVDARPVPSVEEASISLESFDCFAVDGAPGAAAAPEGPGLSTWKAGGPAGAAWNANALVCIAAAHSSCADGEIIAEFRVGKAIVATTTSPVRQHAVEWRFPVKRKQWEKQLDDAAGPAARRAPYRTAIFRLTVTLTCRAPYQLAPGLGPRAEFAADRMFVAGFAYGE